MAAAAAPSYPQLVPAEKPQVVRSGLLVKLGGLLMNQWQQRRFILTTTLLTWFKTTDKDGAMASTPQNSLEIDEDTVAFGIAPSHSFACGREHCFVVSSNERGRTKRIYYLSASSPEERDVWVRAISQVSRLAFFAKSKPVVPPAGVRAGSQLTDDARLMSKLTAKMPLAPDETALFLLSNRLVSVFTSDESMDSLVLTTHRFVKIDSGAVTDSLVFALEAPGVRNVHYERSGFKWTTLVVEFFAAPNKNFLVCNEEAVIFFVASLRQRCYQLTDSDNHMPPLSPTVPSYNAAALFSFAPPDTPAGAAPPSYGDVSGLSISMQQALSAAAQEGGAAHMSVSGAASPIEENAPQKRPLADSIYGEQLEHCHVLLRAPASGNIAHASDSHPSDPVMVGVGGEGLGLSGSNGGSNANAAAGAASRRAGSDWSCPSCTFLNSGAHAAVCHMCGASREDLEPGEDASSGAEAELWRQKLSALDASRLLAELRSAEQATSAVLRAAASVEPEKLSSQSQKWLQACQRRSFWQASHPGALLPSFAPLVRL